MFDAKTRAAGAAEPARLRRRVRRPRRRRRAHDRGGCRACFEHLEPVMRNLADPDTDLRGFVRELGDAARIVAPVSKQNAALFTSMADTFEALGRDPRGAAQDLIAKSPSTMDTAIASFRVQRPFLDRPDDVLHGLLGRDATSCAARCPTINPALEIGTPVQQRGARAQRAARRTPSTRSATSPRRRRPTPRIRALTATVTTLNPQLRFYGPFVTVCNAPELLLHLPRRALLRGRHAPARRSARCSTSPASRTTRSARWAPTSRPTARASSRATRSTCTDQPYGAAITPDGRADCEAGQRGYLERNARFYPKKYKIDQRPADARRPGADLHGPRARAEGRDVHRRPRDRPVLDMAPSASGER